MKIKRFAAALCALAVAGTSLGGLLAVNAYNVVDTDAPSLKDAMKEYTGNTAKVYFMMPNGNNGPAADNDVYVHYPETNDPDTGEVIEAAHDELFVKKGDKSPSWCNDLNLAEDGNHYAGIYWWGGFAAIDDSWPGYKMEIDDAQNGVYYAEVPGDGDLTAAIFNNGVNGGTDPAAAVYNKAFQSADINMEGAYEGDYDTLWGDTYNEFDFGNCIFVIDPNKVSVNPFSNKITNGGDWYFYYGNGCYGSYRTDADEFTSAEDCCLNPSHFDESGQHIGYHEEAAEIDPAYTVTIPAEVNIDGGSAAFKAEGVALNEGQSIAVTLDSASNTASGTVFSAKNGDAVVTYQINDGKVGVDKENNTVASFTEDGESSIDFEVLSTDNATAAGEYTETLVFGVAVKEALNKLTIEYFDTDNNTMVPWEISYSAGQKWSEITLPTGFKWDTYNGNVYLSDLVGNALCIDGTYDAVQPDDLIDNTLTYVFGE